MGRKPACRTETGAAVRGGLAGAAVLAVAACATLEPNAGGGLGAVGPQVTQAAAADALEPGPTALIDARLQPVPEEFELADESVWDGQRTLQGIWVAHPAAQTARRVRILNTDNGYVVDGALFRRDDTGSGPAVLVSSDAAAALDMTPDKVVTLSIVAIKRAPVRPPEEAVARSAPPEETEPEAEPEAGTEADALARQATETPEPAPARAEASAPEPAADAPPPAETPSVTRAGQDDTQGAATLVSPPEGEDELLEDWPLAQQPPANEAARAQQLDRLREDAPTVAETAEIVAVPDSSDAEPAPEPPAARAEPEPAPASEPEPEIEVARAQPAAEPVLEPGPEPVPEAEDALARPFIQAGLFGVEGNAARLVARLEEAGFEARGIPETYGERVLTRVVAGPFATRAARDAALREIRRIGPSDALPVAR